MKQTKQFLLTMLLALVSYATMSAYDFEVKNSDGVTIYYKKLTDNTCEVSSRGSSSYSDRYTGHVAIPSSVEYNGTTYSVTSIGDDAFSSCSSLQSVEIPNSVTSIGHLVFYWCSSLQSVKIPNSVTSIGDNVFNCCRSLQSVEIPNSVTSIGNKVFYGCCSLQSVEIPNSVTYIGSSVFDGCSELTSVMIPSSVTSIGKDAFRGCSSLQSVEIIDLEAWCKISFYNIASNPLSYTRNLYLNGELVTNLIIPNSVTSIESYAFSGCSFLQKIEIPNSVTSIGEKTFYNCTKLRSVTIGAGVLSVGTDAFKETSLYKLTLLPNTAPRGLAEALPSVNWAGRITYVANDNYSDNLYGTIKKYDYLSSMFEVDGIVYVPVSPSERTCAAIDCSYSKDVTNIAIGKTVKYKGVEMKVVEVNPFVLIGNNHVENIKVSAEADVQKYFAIDCRNIKNIELTNNGAVGEYAFSNAMIDVVDGTITLNNTGIVGQYAFQNCSGLKTLTVENTVTNIGGSAFSGSMTKSENAQIVLNNVRTIGSSAFYGCSELQTASLAETISAIGASAFYGCRNLQTINIPAVITTIENSTFNGCSSLRNITLPDGLTAIKSNAFANSGLTSIIIPAATTLIGNGVFNGCTALERFEAKDGDGAGLLNIGSNNYNSSASYNGKGLFYDCPLKEIIIGRNLIYDTRSNYGYSPFYRNTSLEKVTFTDVPTEVFKNEFYGCTSLKEVSIGDGVKKIGDYAFSGCSAIETFSFGMNVQSIGNEAFSDCTNMTKLYAEPTTPPTCGTQALDDINKWECTLYVEPSAMSSYQSAPQWKEFFFMEAKDYGNSIKASKVTLNASEVAVAIGESATLTASIEPDNTTDKTITWTSSDETVATVSAGGKVTAVGIGTATITATAVGGVKAECTVTVKPIVAESVAINKAQMTLNVGDEGVLAATVSPSNTTDKTVAWTSSDVAVAAVDDAGKVTAKKAGKATITATSVSNPSVKATCEVTVLQPATGIEISTAQIAFTKIGESMKITATVKPADASEKGVVWSNSDKAVCTVSDDGTVVATGVGNAVVTAKTVDGGYAAKCEVSVTTFNKITYYVDGKVYYTETLQYGTAITPIAEPEKDGYTFSGWSAIPQTMPAQDVVVEGSFVANAHYIIYMVDGAEYQRMAYKYGEAVSPIAEPKKEGHTFSGWSEVPQTMPNEDIVVNGSFTVNTYTIIYIVDGVEYQRASYKYGESVASVVPSKDGYLFSGWSDVVTTMPAHDVTLTGSFVANAHYII